MTYLKSYKDLIVWQKSMDLAEEIFRLTNLFPKSELYGIVLQMRKASVSIPSNIAEGYGRKYRKEFSQFISISYGSAQELETQLILSERLKFAKASEFIKSRALLVEVSKMIMSLSNKLDAKL